MTVLIPEPPTATTPSAKLVRCSITRLHGTGEPWPCCSGTTAVRPADTIARLGGDEFGRSARAPRAGPAQRTTAGVWEGWAAGLSGALGAGSIPSSA